MSLDSITISFDTIVGEGEIVFDFDNTDSNCLEDFKDDCLWEEDMGLI
jgi:hypothetical protein